MNTSYTKEQIKIILENELFNKEYNIDYNKPQPANCTIMNQLRVYLKNKYPNLFSGRAEILYCYKNRNNEEELLSNMFCKRGNKNRFLDYYIGYQKYCCQKCAANDPEVRRAIENASLKNCGYKCNFASPDPKLNGRATRKAKYGVESCLASKNPDLNGRTTIRRRYGESSIWKTQEYKDLWKNEEWKNKREQNRMKTLDIKYHGRAPIVDPTIMTNRIETMRRNGTFNSSSVETELHIRLKNIFNDVKYIYKDDARYPFNCDFYIPSKDLFIELNFHWTHGKEPFDKNNPRHIEILNKWKEKSIKSNFYKTAINVWTIRDPLKLKTFQENCLNYKIFYNKKDLDEWLRNL